MDLDAFKQWIRSGGTVVAVSGASSWLRAVKISQTRLLNGQPDPAHKYRSFLRNTLPSSQPPSRNERTAGYSIWTGNSLMENQFVIINIKL